MDTSVTALLACQCPPGWRLRGESWQMMCDYSCNDSHQTGVCVCVCVCVRAAVRKGKCAWKCAVCHRCMSVCSMVIWALMSRDTLTKCVCVCVCVCVYVCLVGQVHQHLLHPCHAVWPSPCYHWHQWNSSVLIWCKPMFLNALDNKTLMGWPGLCSITISGLSIGGTNFRMSCSLPERSVIFSCLHIIYIRLPKNTKHCAPASSLASKLY